MIKRNNLLQVSVPMKENGWFAGCIHSGEMLQSWCFISINVKAGKEAEQLTKVNPLING
jgi:hypothetical protein